MLGVSALARRAHRAALSGVGATERALLMRKPVHGSAPAGAGGAAGGGAAAGGPAAATPSLSFVPAFPIGLVSGSVGSFVGIGGALLMVPMAGKLYNLRQLQANATALLPNVATCISSAYMFNACGEVDWTAAALVALSAAVTTRAGARLAHHLPEHTQKLLFGTAMCCLGPAIAAKPLLERKAAPEAAQQGRQPSNDQPLAPAAEREHLARVAPHVSPLREAAAEPAQQPPLAATGEGNHKARVALHVPPLREAAYFVALGSVTGLCSGVMGIGAGVMCTVGLAVGGPAWWGHKTVLGTAFAAQLLPHATGAFTHWQLGNLRLDLVPALVLGSAVGSSIASRVAVDVDEALLRNMFAAYALALGAMNLRTGNAMARAAAAAARKT